MNSLVTSALIVLCTVHLSLRAEESASIAGTVLDSSTRKPLAGVSVVVQDGDAGAATDSLGVFVIRALPPGKYTVRVSRVGYLDKQQRLQLDSADTRRMTILLDPAVVPVGEINVTAGRFAQETFASAANVSVTSQAAFTERGFSTTAEVLREEPGILVQKTTHGHGAPIIRGLIGKYVLLLYNGIRLNKPTFRFGANQYLNTIDLETLDRMEVVRGPSSVLYGSDAIGGTVNMIPFVPAGGSAAVHLQPSALVRYSSADNARSVHLGLAGSYRSLTGAVDVTFKDIDDLRAGAAVGTQSPTGWTESNRAMRLTYTANATTTIGLDYLAVRQKEVPRYDKYVSGEFQQYLYEPQDRDLLAVTIKERQLWGLVSDFRAAFSYQKETEGRLVQRRNSSAVNRAWDEVTTWGGFLQMALTPHSKHRLTIGTEVYYDRVCSRLDVYTAGSAVSERGTFPDDSRYASGGVFAQNEWSPLPRAELIVGARYSWFSISSPLEQPWGNFDAGYRDVTGAVSAAYRPSAVLNVVARWSRGFRAPSLNDAVVLKYSSSGVDAPSPGLDPEVSSNFELGLKLKSPGLSASLFVFRNRLVDLIDRVRGAYNGNTFFDENGNGIRDEGEPNIYQRENVDHAHIRGFEYQMAVRSERGRQGHLNCFWTYGHNRSRNEPLSRIPPFMGTAALRVHLHHSTWAELFTRFAADQRRLSTRDIEDVRIGPNGTDSWATLNLRCRYDHRGIELNLMLENLADKAYKEHGSGIYSPGRNLVASVGFSLD